MKEHQILLYDFQQVNSTIIADASSHGAAGVIRNYDAGGAVIGTDEIYGVKRRILVLPGGSKGGYIQLPDGVLRDLDGLTISCWCRLKKISDRQCLWSFGKDSAIYLDFSSGSEQNTYHCRPCVTSGGRSQEQAIESDVVLKLDNWYLLSMTLDNCQRNSTLSFYIDGVLTASITQRRLCASELNGVTSCYIGYGPYSDEPCNADFSDFSIYAVELKGEDIKSLFTVSDLGRTLADAQAIQLPTCLKDHGSLPLATKGTYGSYIRWESSHPERIKLDGSYHCPEAYETDEFVTLSAWLSFKDATHSISFLIHMEAMPTDSMIVAQDLDVIELPALHSVYKAIYLPTIGVHGSSLTWDSNYPESIDSTGNVTRPPEFSEAVNVTLCVTASFGSACSSREFKATVLPFYSNTSYQKSSIFDVSLHHKSEDLILEQPDNTALPILQGSFAPLNTLRLQGSNIFNANAKRSLDYLRLLDADRMLYMFRRTFQQDTKDALPLGGWDEPTGLLRGHSTGHFLSALALAYASSGREWILNKINYMVLELRKLQLLSLGKPEDFSTSCSPANASQSGWSLDYSTWGEGFLSAYSPDQFALLEQYTPYATIWAPYYTLHKLLAGFLDCYHYAKINAALDAAKGIGNWVYHRLSALTSEQLAKMWSMYIAGEYGGMNESLAQLYTITRETQYLTAAKLFDNPKVFDGISIGVDTITSIHANQHIPQIIGAMAEFKASSKKKYYHIARNFWNIVTSHYAYSIGGVGRGENFKEPDLLAGNIESDRNCETCASYNMLKLTEELYSYEPEHTAYMDYFERTLLNHIAASQNPQVSEHMHHGVTYMLPIGPGQHRSYGSDYHEFTCCHGTGMENHVKYMKAAYFINTSKDTLYVNLYLPSTFTWEDQNVTIKQTQAFPSEHIRFELEGSGCFTLKLRKPKWAVKGFQIKINNEIYSPDSSSSSYVSIEREWKQGDVIEVYAPYSLCLDFTKDQPNGDYFASILYGPLVMVALDQDTEYKTLVLPPNLEEAFHVELGKSPDNITLDYHGLKFIPMYQAHHDCYHTYFKIIRP